MDGLKITDIGLQTLHQNHQLFKDKIGRASSEHRAILNNLANIKKNDKTVIRNNNSWGLWKTEYEAKN